MAFCSNCGVPTVPGAIVCAQCGHALGYAPPPVTYAAPPPPAAPAFAPAPAPHYAAAPPPPMKKARPVGVAILSVLQWIGAGFLVLYGVVLTFMGPFLATAIQNDPRATADQQAVLNGLGPIFVVIGVFCFAFAGLTIWIGWGLWVGKNWARITHVVFASIGGGFTAIFAIAALFTFPPLAAFYLLFVAWYAFLIWYWTRPGVKAYYTPGAATTATPTAPSW